MCDFRFSSADLEQKEREREVQKALSGGYYRNGAYFYPITDPPDRIFLVMGPGIPCNAYNNNSVLVASGNEEVTTEDGVTGWVTQTNEVGAECWDRKGLFYFGFFQFEIFTFQFEIFTW